MPKHKWAIFQQALSATLPTLVIFLTLLCVHEKAGAVTNNLLFNGNLVAEPCVLDPTTENIELDFGTIIDKYLYINERVHSQPFTVRLLECDLSLGTTVTLTFTGTPDGELTDMLAVSGMASGIAIGLETPGGAALPFNKTTPAFELTSGTTELVLKGYVQARPTAIQNRSIVRGGFSAVATFTLNYE